MKSAVRPSPRNWTLLPTQPSRSGCQRAPSRAGSLGLGAMKSRDMHRLIIILICAVCGCSHPTPESELAAMPPHIEPAALDEKQVIKIVQMTLSTNAGFRPDKQSYEVSRHGSNWWVTVSCKPAMPGGFCTVEVTPDGRVKKIYPGL